MENVAGQQGLALQQLFPYKSSSFFGNSNPHKISFFNARGLKLGHFDIFNMLFISGILKVAAHKFMKSRSRDGLAAKGLISS